MRSWWGQISTKLYCLIIVFSWKRNKGNSFIILWKIQMLKQHNFWNTAMKSSTVFQTKLWKSPWNYITMVRLISYYKGLFIDKDTSYNEGAFFSEISKICLDAFYYSYMMYIKCLSWKKIIFGEKNWILVGICNVVTISEISLKKLKIGLFILNC